MSRCQSLLGALKSTLDSWIRFQLSLYCRLCLSCTRSSGIFSLSLSCRMPETSTGPGWPSTPHLLTICRPRTPLTRGHLASLTIALQAFCSPSYSASAELRVHVSEYHHIDYFAYIQRARPAATTVVSAHFFSATTGLLYRAISHPCGAPACGA